MAKFSITETDLGWKQILREMHELRSKEVVVGLLEGDKNHGQTIAEYAAYNEYGTESTPSRPFMRTAFDENLKDIKLDFRIQGNQVLTAQRTAYQALTVIGQKQADRIKNTITDRNFLPKLAKSTIGAKKGSTKTLVDTGAMVNAVHMVIRDRTE